MNQYNQPPPPGVASNINTDNNQNQFLELINSLKIPDIIKDLPKFDGNPHSLHEFINNVEEILQLIKDTASTPYGQILLRAIRNKVEGQANGILNMHATALNWDDIKNNLILHYADKRSEASLIRDLHNLRQGNKTIETFYGEIINIQSTLNNNLVLNENDVSAVRAKRDLFTEMCLNSFLSGIREPLGSSIRAMRPNTLAIALSYCIKEQNIHYQRSSFHNYRPRYNNYHPYQQNFNTDRAPPTPKLEQNKFQGSFKQNFNNQRPFNNFQPNDNTVYAQKNHNPFNQERSITAPKHEPNGNNTIMSRYTNRSTQNNRNIELNNIESINNENLFPNIDICNIEETENFRQSASKNQQDT